MKLNKKYRASLNLLLVRLFMKTLQRSHSCGELTVQHIGLQVVLNGWVGPRRDLGGLIFIDLRDRFGVTQIVFTETDVVLHKRAEQLRTEYVIGIKGKDNKLVTSSKTLPKE